MNARDVGEKLIPVHLKDSVTLPCSVGDRGGGMLEEQRR